MGDISDQVDRLIELEESEPDHETSGTIVRVSEKAIKLKLEDGDEIWLPKSKIDGLPEEATVGDEIAIGVPVWLWEKKEAEAGRELY